MMTIEQARDRVAELTGKPVPLTLDAVAKLWPKEWVLDMQNNELAVIVSAWPLLRPVGVYFSECVRKDESANHELHARLLLLVAVLEHEAAEAAGRMT